MSAERTGLRRRGTSSCPMCAQAVRVDASGEGTCCYVGAEAEAMRGLVDEIRGSITALATGGLSPLKALEEMEGHLDRAIPERSV